MSALKPPSTNYDPYTVPKGSFFPSMPNHRRVVPRGIPGIVLVAAFVGLSIKWLRDAAYWRHQRIIIRNEKIEARYNILPILKAEEDRNFLRARAKQMEIEEKYCKEIPGWVVGGGAYNTVWMPPAFPPGHRTNNSSDY